MTTSEIVNNASEERPVHLCTAYRHGGGPAVVVGLLGGFAMLPLDLCELLPVSRTLAVAIPLNSA